jgi:hypothetical protein
MKSLRFSRTSRTGTWLIATVSLLAIGSAFAQRDRITQVLDNYRTVVVPGHLNPLAKTQFDRGVVDPGFPLPGMTLTVRRTADQQSGLNQLLAAQQNPASPQYHKWLTPEAFASRFGASPNDLATIGQWLESHGFHIKAVARGGTFIRFDARASQVQDAFKTEIHQFTVNGVKHYANVSEPSLPANLAPLVLAIGGMDDFGPHPNHVEMASATGKPSAHYLANTKNNLAPADLAWIYDTDGLQIATGNGAGQTVVVIGASDVTLTDLVGYRSAFGLGTAPIALQVIHPDLPPGTGNSVLATEATMQLELVSGTADRATLILDADSNVWNALADAVDNARGQVISMSFGTCEIGTDGSSAASIRTTMQAANAEGITVVAASGDAGAAGCDTGVIADGATQGAYVTLPASMPEVTGVGGTEFNEGGSTYWGATGSHTAIGYIPEVVWNDTPTLVASQTFAASGGGVSTLYGLPTWQTIAAGLLANVVGTGRNVPDVAMAASATHDGYVIYMNGRLSTAAGTPYTVGGTTASASVFAGILAMVNESLGAGSSSGNINPILYNLATADFGLNLVFHTTTGNNEIMCAAGQTSPSCAGGDWGYAAATLGTAYNQATGLGSVDASALGTAWGLSGAPPAISSLAPPTATAGGSITANTLTITGTGFTGATAVSWTFNGASTSLTLGANSATSQKVTVPSGLLSSAGTAYLRVVGLNGLYSAPEAFTVTGAIVSHLSPSYATLGNTAGFTLTVTGTGFSPQAKISFGGTTLATTNVNSTTLTTVYCSPTGCPITPAMISSAGLVPVKVIDGATSTAFDFAVNAKPTIVSTSNVINSSLNSPNATASMGGADTTVTITGTGFTNHSTVTWAPPTGTTTLLAATFVSATSLTVVVPSAFLTASGTAHLQVVSGDGVSASTAPYAFVIGLAPTITWLSPSHTTASRSAALTLTVNGTGFSSPATISFNGTAVTTSYTSSTVLTASIPSASLIAGTPAVFVTNTGGAVSNTIDLTVNTAPAITGIDSLASGATANMGISHFALTIAGTNFASGSTVTWTPVTPSPGSPTTLSSVWNSGTSMTATVPSTLLTLAGTANVKVVGPTPDFSASTPYVFGIVVAPPTVTVLSPAVATAGNPGLPITITGTGFTSKSTVVCIDSTPSSHALTSLLYSSASSLIATLPTTCLTAAGAYRVQVTTGGVPSVASVATPPLDIFTVNAAPSITSITPSSAMAGSASAVTMTIAGTGFSTGSVVTWLGRTTTYTLNGSTCATTIKCTATVPASYLTTAGLAPVKVKTVDGMSSTLMNFSIASAAITGFNPSYAMVGGSAFALTVNGTGFQPGAVVKWWNGTSWASVTTSFVSATQLTASISTIPGTAGPMPIEVVQPVPTAGDGTTSVASNFPIIDAIAPTIASVSPSSIVAGSPAASITIKGVNFVAGTGTGGSFVPGSLVNLGGVALAVTTGTTSQVVATLPLQASPGTLNLTVLNGTEVSQPIPIVIVGPTILSVSPNAVAAGTNGTSVVVTGTNFVPGTKTSGIFYNNSNVYLNGSGSPLTPTAVTSTSITATVLPASMNAIGSLSLVVQNPGGAATSAIAVPIGAPTITSLSPSSAGAGTVAGASTLAVTVNGTNFVTGGSNPSKVYWAGALQTTTYVSSTKLTVAILGSVLAATPSQIVTVQNGSVASSGTTFNVSGPTISSLSPTSTLVDTAAFTLTVNGANFVSGSVVSFGATALTTHFVKASQLTATVPADLFNTATALAAITVANGAAISPSVNFAVGPTIATLSPALAPAGSAPFTITVNGTNFAGGSVVMWGLTALTTNYVSSTQLTAAVTGTQLGTGGTPAIAVTNGSALATSPSGTTFAVNAPTIASGGLSAVSALAGGASFPLTVTGTNFVTGTNASVVMWGLTPLATTVNSASQLTATVTSAVLATTVGSPIGVTVVNGSATPASNAPTFTVSGPAITMMYPTSAAAGGAAFTLTVAGSSFNSSSVVMWGSTPLTTTYVSSAQITGAVTNPELALAGSQTITVQNGSATATSGSSTFTVSGPTLTSLGATSAAAGTASLTLTVNGTNFVTGGTAASKVYWGATGLTTNYVSATQLTVALTTQLATTVGSPVSVTVQNGTVANVSGSITFTVNDPSISSLGPVSTDPAGTSGFTLTVTGTNFVTGVSTVLWNGVALATPISVSATQITVAVPTGNLLLAGTPSVTVQNGSATLTSAGSTFTVTPTVTGLSQTSASSGGPTFTLTVSGVGFVPGAVVYFGGAAMSTIYVNSTTLTATVLSTSIASSGPASVMVHAGGATSLAGITFTITP